jgi:hypothetical protein
LNKRLLITPVDDTLLLNLQPGIFLLNVAESVSNLTGLFDDHLFLLNAGLLDLRDLSLMGLNDLLVMLMGSTKLLLQDMLRLY